MKRLRNIIGVIVVVAVLCIYAFANDGVVRLDSPDGDYVTTIYTSELDGSVKYRVEYKGAELVAPSTLGFVLENNSILSDSIEIVSVVKFSDDTTWEPPYGDRAEYVDNYNGVRLSLKRNGESALFDVEFKAYEEGVAFRYLFNKDDVKYKRELTEVNVDPYSEVWGAVHSQGLIQKTLLKDLDEIRERPFVGKNPNGVYFALGEAAQLEFPRMKFKFNAQDDKLGVVLGSSADIRGLESSPWRYIMAGGSAGELLENNFLLLNLNEPCVVENPERFKPGKVLRDVTLTTTGAKACVDFAKKHNILYVHLDAGWYGREFFVESDATTVTPDPLRTKGPFDMEEFIRYAKSQGREVMLYVNRRQLERQLEDILPLYKEWGVAAIKYGFVKANTQWDAKRNYYQIKEGAKYGMTLDIHDDLRPTGYQRTYPNWLSAEGIRGDEAKPSNSQTVSTIFTRCIAGAADNTVCYFAERVTAMGSSHASQMAKAVCIYSPLQFVYWYDRPEGAPINIGGASNTPSVIKEIPDLKFFDDVPTVWDDVKVIEGEIGEYVTIARRSGDSWYVGSINGEQSHNVNFDLDFLESGVKYQATTYYDDATMNTETNVRIVNSEVDSSTRIERELLKNNGFVMEIRPIKE